jgi:hypothetical protein
VTVAKTIIDRAHTICNGWHALSLYEGRGRVDSATWQLLKNGVLLRVTVYCLLNVSRPDGNQPVLPTGRHFEKGASCRIDFEIPR